nr:DNA-directed RNA polymerase subunit A' [Candidatus Njordarchaeota archaeon]
MALRVPKIIERIRFGFFSPDEIRKLSVTRIITADTYDEDGLPIDSGLMDSRLGTVEPGRRCKTCGNRVGDCPGHFGHIELARPVMHVGFGKLIYKALRATCRKCSRLLLPEAELEKFKKEMDEHERTWNELSQAVIDEVIKHAIRVSVCPHCGETQRKIGFEKPTSFTEETEAGPVRLTPSDVRDRLERIPDEDEKLLGVNPKYARLEWTVLTVLPVPPIAVRPSITLESGVRSEDDLTHKLVDVVRINQRLKENIDAGAPQLIVEDLWELLQYHVTTYFDNEVSGIPPARHRSGRALRTLAQRLKGKEGRFRSNLSGKRVDFSARTVISPDPNISINDVGVPFEVVKILTIPERVTTWNVEEIKRLVRNGPEKHPGANYVIRLDGRRVDLRFVKDLESIADTIESGFIVERHLREGDVVLFNRQPSLHRMSIMAHEVRVMPYKTFRLNLCVCPPYNADFDGDEMNLHVPQSEEARAEAKILMRVQEQILSPRYGGPIIGGIQDYISAAYLLTKRGTFLTRKEVCLLLQSAGIMGELPEPELRNPDRWGGKQIVSMLLPKDLSYSWKAKICHKCDECKREECTYDAYCVVRDGKLLSGVFDKNAFGAGVPESIYHYIIKMYGNDLARSFIDSITKLVVSYITLKGFTMGIDDVELKEEATNRIREILDEGQRKVDQLIEVYRRGEMEALPGRSLEETLEMRIMQELSEARDGAGDVADQYLGMKNHAVIMARTGARGDRLNLAQMAACVGQQSVRGVRIMRGYQKRSLPHFKQGELGSEARGFVPASYRTGLTPIEFFFHAMGGREGLVDTAVRTSTSGYMQRRLINALQDIKAEYDGTVRTSVGRIVQFKYGEDGVDPSKSYHGQAVNLDAILKRNLGEKFRR